MSNSSEKSLDENALRPLNATIHCKKVGPDLGDRGDGEEIGAVLSWGRERPRYYYRPIQQYDFFVTSPLYLATTRCWRTERFRDAVTEPPKSKGHRMGGRP